RLDAARRAPLGASALRGSAARDRRGLSRARADPRADGRSVVGGPGLHLGGGARADRRGGALPRSLAPAPRPHAAGLHRHLRRRASLRPPPRLAWRDARRPARPRRGARLGAPALARARRADPPPHVVQRVRAARQLALSVTLSAARRGSERAATARRRRWRRWRGRRAGCASPPGAG